MHIGLNRRGDHMSQLFGVLGGGREPDSAGEIVVHVGQLESEMLERILTEAGGVVGHDVLSGSGRASGDMLVDEIESIEVGSGRNVVDDGAGGRVGRAVWRAHHEEPRRDMFHAHDVCKMRIIGAFLGFGG